MAPCFQYYLRENRDNERIQFYREKWINSEQLLIQKENEEYNTNTNKKWKNCLKNSKDLWRMINWKGKIQDDDQESLSYQEIYDFFTNIFQSKKTSKSPVISDISYEINNYHMEVPATDVEIKYEEITETCRDIGNGIGIDGIPPIIAKILPESIRLVMKNLFQNIFTSEYPNEWESQLLFPIKKKEHTINNPKLRGIGLGVFFSRMYDNIIFKRFNMLFPNWQCAFITITSHYSIIRNR